MATSYPRASAPPRSESTTTASTQSSALAELRLMPVENMLAMWETAREYGVYR
jgi:hypothetical protein